MTDTPCPPCHRAHATPLCCKAVAAERRPRASGNPNTEIQHSRRWTIARTRSPRILLEHARGCTSRTCRSAQTAECGSCSRTLPHARASPTNPPQRHLRYCKRLRGSSRNATGWRARVGRDRRRRRRRRARARARDYVHLGDARTARRPQRASDSGCGDDAQRGADRLSPARASRPARPRTVRRKRARAPQKHFPTAAAPATMRLWPRLPPPSGASCERRRRRPRPGESTAAGALRAQTRLP